MATKTELEIRIRELERRLENDEQDMVEVCERIDVLDSKVDNFRGRASDRHEENLHPMIREKHNTLCDVVDAMLTYVRPNMQADYHKAVRSARIYTGDINTADQAWDEPTNGTQDDETPISNDGADVRVGADCNADSTGDVSGVGVDAIMGEMREASTKRFIPEVTYSVKRFKDWDVRPHIKMLVGKRDVALSMMDNCEDANVELHKAKERVEAERDDYKKSSNDWARHFKSERTARISAEAEVARLRDVCEKLIQLDNEKLICLSGQLSYEESNKVRKAVIAMRQAIDNAREQ